MSVILIRNVFLKVKGLVVQSNLYLSFQVLGVCNTFMFILVSVFQSTIIQSNLVVVKSPLVLRCIQNLLDYQISGRL
jgi:hypothetical protein